MLVLQLAVDNLVLVQEDIAVGTGAEQQEEDIAVGTGADQQQEDIVVGTGADQSSHTLVVLLDQYQGMFEQEVASVHSQAVRTTMV